MHKKSAVITGASQGIGEAVAKHLAEKGYHLLLIARSKDKLESLQAALSGTNAGAIIQVSAVDVADFGAINRAVTTFYEKAGSIDLLFNNAGYVKRGTSDLDPEAFATMINANLIGAVNVVRAVAPFMKKQSSGYIINMSSRNAEVPRSFLGGYAATKAGLLAYSESLYKELAPYRIKVTAICPGFVDTEMTADVNVDRDKLIKTADICATIDFLLTLSPAAALKTLSLESVVQVGGYV